MPTSLRRGTYPTGTSGRPPRAPGQNANQFSADNLWQKSGTSICGGLQIKAVFAWAAQAGAIERDPLREVRQVPEGEASVRISQRWTRRCAEAGAAHVVRRRC